MESGSNMFGNAIFLLFLMIALILLFFWVKSTGGFELFKDGFNMVASGNASG